MKRRRKGTKKSVFFIVAILILAFTYASFFGIDNYYGDNRTVYVKGAEDIRWGIDISGGVEAIFKPDISGKSSMTEEEIAKAEANISDDDINAAKEIIETRLLSKGITESEVRVDYDNKQVVVRFPWAAGETDFDPVEAVADLGETAMLTFCEGSDDNETVILTGSKHVKKASPGYDSENAQYVVQLELTDAGKSLFAEATARLNGEVISIWMDDTLISAPTVNDTITDGHAVISGDFDADSVQELADKINAGSLPFALSVDESKLQVVSPSLGSQALNVMTIAGVAAFIVICILMIVLFRLPGFVASICLMGQVAGMLACSSGFFAGSNGVTLTIPGIAGIILSIGMGVDANVISSERIREEFRNGKTIDGAIDAGFDNSFNAVLDGNVTVFIISAIMMGAFGTPDTFMGKIFSPIMQFFGSSVTGSVYSFGYTLLIGVIFNMIMGVYCSRAMLRSISRFKFLRKPWLYGGAKNGK